jgi:hypothetical protein
MSSFKFVARSSNAKTGPMPVVYSSRQTCPDSCAHKGNGCYAESGPIRLQWRKVDQTGISLEQLCESIRTIPIGSLWRYGVAGDLPGNGDTLDRVALDKLVRANRGRRGFTYTHKLSDIDAIRDATARGFVVNVSADSIALADHYYAQDLPVTVVVPRDAPEVTFTREGVRVVVCPAQTREDVTCQSCGLCAVASRRVIVGFRAHGSGAGKVERRLKVVNL